TDRPASTSCVVLRYRRRQGLAGTSRCPPFGATARLSCVSRGEPSLLVRRIATMTTLPQTTGTRFPRAGGRAPSLPAPLQPGLSAPNSNTLSASDVIRVLRANALLVIVFVILSLAAGFGVFKLLEQYAPSYTATAHLRVQSPMVYDPNTIGGFT